MCCGALAACSRNDGSGSKSTADRAKAGETEGGGAPALSKKTDRGYDCQNQKSPPLKTTWYSGRMGTETGYMSGRGAYYLGMNYPPRFVLFGGLLTVCALSMETQTIGQRFFRSTLVMGLLYLFISLWIMSIFGNYGDMHSWERAKQIELFHWSILFGVAACLLIPIQALLICAASFLLQV